MRLIKRTEILFLPKKTLSVTFFSYPKLRGEKLDFFYNTAFKKTWLLESKSVTLDGKVTDNHLMRGLQDNYIYIPSGGKQTNEHEFIILYIDKNDLSFAKIEF